MILFWKDWVEKYPIISIEDGMAENDYGWKVLTDSIGQSTSWSATICLSRIRSFAKGIDLGVAN